MTLTRYICVPKAMLAHSRTSRFPTPLWLQECLEAGEKDTIRTECSTALSWLASKQDMQSRLTLHDDPALLTSDVKKRQDTLARVCDPLIAKAKAARAAKAKAAAAAASAAAAAAKEKA